MDARDTPEARATSSTVVLAMPYRPTQASDPSSTRSRRLSIPGPSYPPTHADPLLPKRGCSLESGPGAADGGGRRAGHRETGGGGGTAAVPPDPDGRRRRRPSRHAGGRPLPLAGGREIRRGPDVGRRAGRLHPPPPHRPPRPRRPVGTAAGDLLRRPHRPPPAGRDADVLHADPRRSGEGRPVLAPGRGRR